MGGGTNGVKHGTTYGLPYKISWGDNPVWLGVKLTINLARGTHCGQGSPVVADIFKTRDLIWRLTDSILPLD